MSDSKIKRGVKPGVKRGKYKKDVEPFDSEIRIYTTASNKKAIQSKFTRKELQQQGRKWIENLIKK